MLMVAARLVYEVSVFLFSANDQHALEPGWKSSASRNIYK